MASTLPAAPTAPAARRSPALPVARSALLCIAVAWACGAPAFGADAPPPAAVNAGLGPAPAGLSRATPREALAGFLAAGQDGDFDVAAHCLDLDAIAPDRQRAEGARLARRLFLVLLHHGGVDPETVSHAPLGSDEAAGEAREERVADLTVRGREVPVILGLRRGPGGTHVWLVSRVTASSIDALYRSNGYGWIGDHLPSPFFSVSFLGIQLWQWAALAIALVLGYAAARLLGRGLLVTLGAAARRTAVTWDDALVKALDGPLAIVLWGLMLTLTASWAGLPAGAAAVSRVFWRLLTLLGFGWLLFRLWDGAVERMRQHVDRANHITLGYIPIISRTGKFFVSLIVFLAALDVIGLNVVAMLAGLGIGGIAIAFAAQKTIENIFGAVTIAGDRPFKIGDYVTAAGITGTVEEIGLRSTRLRTLDRLLVTIPNGLLAAGTIANLTSRDRYLFNPKLGVRYETTADQLTFIVDEIGKVLALHPKVFQEAHRTRFAGFGASSLDVEVTAWVLATDFHEYTAIAEELNFAIARIVEQAGTSFAFPSQTLYLRRDSHHEPDPAAEAAREAAARHGRGDPAVP